MNTNTLRELRKYLYGVAIAFIPIAVYYGWVDVEASVLIVPLLVALFNLTPKDVGTDPVKIETSEAVEITLSDPTTSGYTPKHADVV